MLPALKKWRIRIFISTWLCYAGLYFCRKPFYIVKATLGESLHIDASFLGSIGATYLIAYAIGQFVAGLVGNRLGPRVLLLSGMIVSLLCNFIFGFTNSPMVFLIFMALNGLAQATGWPGTVGTMANWFHREERGTVMGFWSTNFQVGGVLANGLAAWALGAYGYQYSFFCGGLVLLAVWAFFIFNQRNHPQDVGLPAINADSATDDRNEKWSRSTSIDVILIGTFYFFLKFIRYALWSWAPFFLAKNFHLHGDQAGYLSTIFDLCGVAGVIIVGVLSDRYFKSQRAGISLIMIVGMLIACFFMYTLGHASVFIFALSMGLVGFTLYGPDALMSGAGAMDVGSGRQAALAAGIINGMGSVGAVVQELLIGSMYDRDGGSLDSIFLVLLVSAGMAAVTLGVVYLRNCLRFSNV